ncbi:MAG: hypothetical protein ACQCN6_06810 [Candidatus Bathyarchaeia archaeon]
MILEIETDAALILLKVLLSCQCAISKKTEEEIAHYLLSQRSKISVDFKRLIDLAGGPTFDTVFRRLRDCCFYSKNNLDKVVITKEDVYRHFCSAYHWKINEEALTTIPENANTPISNVASWFVGHMLLPVRLMDEKGSVRAEYSGSDSKISIFNVFIPPDMELHKDAIYSMHFASVISEITLAQAELINRQLEVIDQFIEFRKEIKTMDYGDFQKFGNYRNLCEGRYRKYFNNSFK